MLHYTNQFCGVVNADGVQYAPIDVYIENFKTHRKLSEHFNINWSIHTNKTTIIIMCSHSKFG